MASTGCGSASIGLFSKCMMMRRSSLSLTLMCGARSINRYETFRFVRASYFFIWLYLSIPSHLLCEASSGVAEHSYANPSASCQAQREGAAVWGSFHGIRSDRLRVWRSSFTLWCTVRLVSPMYMRKSLPMGFIR